MSDPAPRQRPGRADQQQAELDTLRGRLAGIAELHQDRGSMGLCSTCLLPWPCETGVLATGRPPQR